MQTNSLFYIYAPFSSSLHHFLHAPLCFSHDFSSSSVITLSKIMKRPFYRHDCQARPLLRTCYCPNLEPFPTLSHQRPVKDRKSFKGTGWVKNSVRWLFFQSVHHNAWSFYFILQFSVRESAMHCWFLLICTNFVSFFIFVFCFLHSDHDWSLILPNSNNSLIVWEHFTFYKDSIMNYFCFLFFFRKL